jgi:hypothetical protein
MCDCNRPDEGCGSQALGFRSFLGNGDTGPCSSCAGSNFSTRVDYGHSDMEGIATMAGRINLPIRGWCVDLFVGNKKKPEKRQNDATMGGATIYACVSTSHLAEHPRRCGDMPAAHNAISACQSACVSCAASSSTMVSAALRQNNAVRSARSVAPNRSAVGSVPLEPFLKLYLFEQKIGHQAAKT